MAKPKQADAAAPPMAASAVAAEEVEYIRPPLVDIQAQFVANKHQAATNKAAAEAESRDLSAEDIRSRLADDGPRGATPEAAEMSHVGSLEWIKSQLPKFEPRSVMENREAKAREEDLALIQREMNRG